MSREEEGMVELDRPLDRAAPISPRAPGPRPRRLSRRAILLFAGGSAIGLALALVTGLSPARHPTAPRETATVEHRQMTDMLATAPRDYAAVAKQRAEGLGPPPATPLPISDVPASTALMSGSTDTASDGDRAAERQQRRQQRESARASRLFAAGAGSERAGKGEQDAVSPASETGSPESTRMPPASGTDAQDRRAEFAASEDQSSNVNKSRLREPSGAFVITAGSTIAAALITGLSSDLPGEVVAQVTEDVFDSVTGRARLIPQGTRLIGRYDARVGFGQSRALVVWTRLILPDGRSLDLDRLIGTDAAGQSGFADRVDHHAGKLLKAGLLSTLFGAGVNAATSRGGGNDGIAFAIRESAGQSVGRAGDKLIDRQLDVSPTITIRPGARVRVLVSQDLIMAPWPTGGG